MEFHWMFRNCERRYPVKNVDCGKWWASEMPIFVYDFWCVLPSKLKKKKPKNQWTFFVIVSISVKQVADWMCKYLRLIWFRTCIPHSLHYIRWGLIECVLATNFSMEFFWRAINRANERNKVTCLLRQHSSKNWFFGQKSFGVA